MEKRRLIAIVEDDPSLASLFFEMLGHSQNWQIQLFADGKEAKDELPSLGADLILLDVGLPNLDGASLYRMLRGHSRTKNIPIVLVTGSHGWELNRMGLQTGLVLRKPFKRQELLGIIQALLPEEREG